MKPIRHLSKNNKEDHYHTACGLQISIIMVDVLTRIRRTSFIVTRVTCKRCQTTARYKQLLAKHIARRLKGHI